MQPTWQRYLFFRGSSWGAPVRVRAKNERLKQTLFTMSPLKTNTFVMRKYIRRAGPVLISKPFWKLSNNLAPTLLFGSA
jgi:hypothetical protein